MSPRASVLLPFRDAAETLGEALDSLLAEALDTEVLAVDDGSTDAGPEIVASRMRHDARVRLLRQPRLGIVAALDHALAQASAPFCVRMDADDLHVPPRIAASLAALEADRSLGLVGTQVEVLASVPVGEGLLRYVAWQNTLLDAASHAREVFVESPLCHPTFAMRTEVLRQLGGYRDGPFPEDYDLVLRVHARGLGIAKAPGTGLRWRHADGRLTFRDPRYSVDAFRELKVEHLRPWLARSGRPLVVWGAGRDGRRFARSLLAGGTSIASFVDIDPRKIGRLAYGRPILSPDALPPPSAAFVIVAVGTTGARQLIREFLGKRAYQELHDFRCVA